MKITGLTLFDYIRLRVSRIRELEMNTENGNTQLIIGSNGSGKSSIMHELFPFPPIKSSFGKTGFKSLTLQHDGSAYNLIYDVHKGHSFFRDNENLNVSGTNEIQRELIYEHFGITNEVHTLLKCALPICDMVPSQRKKVLMNMNPIDISVFIDKYQKVHKDVVSYSNNLDRLYTRQKQLMTQKLPDEQYQKMLEHKVELENQEKLLLIWMTRTSAELELYPEIHRNTDIPTDMPVRIKKLFRELTRFNSISRINSASELVEYRTRSNMLANELSELEVTLSETITTLNECESKKVLLAQSDCNVEQEFEMVVNKLTTFKFKETFEPIRENDLPMMSDLIDRLRSTLVDLSYIEYDVICDKSELHGLYSRVLSFKAELDSITAAITQLQRQHDELKKTIREYRIGSPCDTRCELLQMYTSTISTKQTDLEKLAERIQAGQRKYEEVTIHHTEASRCHGIQEKLWNYIDKVTTIINSNLVLMRTFPSDLILTRIRESPMLLVNDVLQHISLSEAHLEYVKLTKRLRELEVINNSLASKKQMSMEILDTELINHSNQLKKLREKYAQKLEAKTHLDERCKLIESFIGARSQANELLTMITRIESDSEIKASRTYLLNFYDILNRILNNTRSELVDITNISKEQEQIIVRLDSEVNSIINELKPMYEDAKIIEKSLYDLPIKYTRTFINNIIETTNYFINEIMTYPMHLIPIPEGEICDFNFPIIMENEVRTKDISSCSDGQKAIIQLSFNLAMVVELNFNRYPIYCDEIDRTLDTKHSKRLTDMLLSLVSQGIVEQLFVIGHHPSMLNSFAGTGNITVLNSDNIVLPDSYNENVRITYN